MMITPKDDCVYLMQVKYLNVYRSIETFDCVSFNLPFISNYKNRRLFSPIKRR